MNIKVNQSEWESLEPGRREQIEVIVAQCFDGIQITPDESEPAEGGEKDFCTIACNIAEQAAIMACKSEFEDPDQQAACIAVAKKAGEKCREACAE